ncbi:MAG: hypothetical protein OEU49_09770 [Chromatiales bacterium]|jgi:hypothetical protein|nr:hypothetical protein [Chromatiales bacterium]
MTQRASNIVTSVALLCSFMAAPPAALGQTGSPQASDPVVNDVVRMLEVGIEAELILQWLESSGRRPAPLSADDVIALSQAQAPKQLIQTLLDMAALPPPAVVSAPPTQTPAAPGVPAPVQPGVATADGECCMVDFSVEYRVSEDKEGEELEQPGRDLFVYLDGRFLARFQSLGNIDLRGPAGLKARVAPGAHTLRLTRELHTEAGGRKNPGAWNHETTVSPAAIGFRVEPGANWNMDLRWIQSEFSTRRPLTWRWSRDGVEVAGQERVGAFREEWPYLCEDAQASLDAGTMSGWRAKDRLKNCVTWDSLWPDGVQTTRAQVLDTLRQDDFDPPIRSVGRID